jgi:hypothetical protein
MNAGRDISRLKVTLAGSRNYVQGTQMLARAAELLADFGPSPQMLKKAGFRRITSRLVAASRLPEGPEGQRPIGAATFGTSAGDTAIHFFELPSDAPRAPVRHMPAMSHTTIPAEFNGAFDFSAVHEFEDLLNLMVQSTKRVHEASQPDARDIWFTGLTDGELPLRREFIPMSGRVTIDHVRTVARPPQYQTLSQATASSPGVVPVSVVLSFVFTVG